MMPIPQAGRGGLSAGSTRKIWYPVTYGFAAYQSGDEIAVISKDNLREYDDNPRRKVTAVERVNDKDWLLTLDGPAPDFKKDDVMDNITINTSSDGKIQMKTTACTDVIETGNAGRP